MRRWGYAAIVLVCCSPRDVTVGDDGGTATGDDSARLDLAWGEETESGALTPDLPPGCGAQAGLESSVPHFAWVIEQSTAIRERAWDHDGDPETPDMNALTSVRGLLEQFAFVYGHGDPCGADVETSFSYSPSVDAEPIPSAAACQVAALAPPLAFNDSYDIVLDFELVRQWGVGGANPLAAAHAAAVERLVDNSHGTGDYVFLLVHSPPNCAEGEDLEALDPALAASVQVAYEDLGIPTYVVGFGVGFGMQSPADGIPDADPFEYFNTLAEAGGRPSQHEIGRSFYLPGPELFAAIDFPSPGVGPCVFELDPSPPEDVVEQEMQVLSQGTTFPFTTSACGDLGEGEGAWVWIEKPEVLALCGTACVAHDGVCHPEPPHVRGSFEASWPCE